MRFETPTTVPTMPFPTTCPCPRPILKKHCAPSASDVPPTPSIPSLRDESAQLLDIDPSILQPLVHFASTNNLTRTFAAYSPSIYDRSPIVVSPNKCSLPARGCPGKTYLPGDDAARSLITSKTHDSNQVGYSAASRHLHPRAVRVQVPYGAADEEDDELTPRTSTSSSVHSHPLPPLVLDLSSSSESDESDGFSSPPQDCAPMCEYHTLLASLIYGAAVSFPLLPALPNMRANRICVFFPCSFFHTFESDVIATWSVNTAAGTSAVPQSDIEPDNPFALPFTNVRLILAFLVASSLASLAFAVS